MEDLVFRKAMAIYVEKEYEKIEEEDPHCEFAPHEADPKVADKLYSRQNCKNNLKNVFAISKKVFRAAAMVVFVALISISSVIVASAGVREAVADAIYHLVYEDNEKYTLVGIEENTDFVNREVYDWEEAYAPTYLPEGFSFSDEASDISKKIMTYENGDTYIDFSQNLNSSPFMVDTENADKIEKTNIGKSEALVILKGNNITVCWSEGNTFFAVWSNASKEEVIAFAESVKPLN